MKISFTLFCILFCFLSHGQYDKNDFPTEIKTEKSNDQTRVKGTKIYANIPSEFQLIETFSLNRKYQKTEDIYIEFVETRASNFQQVKPIFSKEKIEADGLKLDIHKNIVFNGLDAIFIDGPSKIRDGRALTLIFGDSNFFSQVTGVYPKNNPEIRNTLLEIFKNLYHEKNYTISPIELERFDFDQSITEFKYALKSSGIPRYFVFTEDGVYHPRIDRINTIAIGVMPKLDDNGIKKFLKSLIENLEHSEVDIESYKIISKKIGDYSVSIMNTEIKDDNSHLYAAILNNNEISVVFKGTAFNTKTNLLDKYKETVKSIIIK